MALLAFLFVPRLGTRGTAMPGRYEMGRGQVFCAELSEQALDHTFRVTLGCGLAMLLGVALIAVGAHAGPDPQATNPLKRGRGVLIAGVGALAMGLGTYGLSRADSASLAASQATLAITDAIPEDGFTGDSTKDQQALLKGDRSAYRKCVEIHAAWTRSRIDSAALLKAAFNSEPPPPPPDGKDSVATNKGTE